MIIYILATPEEPTILLTTDSTKANEALEMYKTLDIKMWDTDKISAVILSIGFDTEDVTSFNSKELN